MLSVSPGFRQAAVDGTPVTRVDIYAFAADETTLATMLGNQHIESESMRLTQAICDESDLKFGGCIASSFEIDFTDNYAFDTDLTGRYITVYLTQTAAAVGTYPGAHLIPGEQRDALLLLGRSDDNAVYPSGSYYRRSIAIFSGEVYSCRFAKNRLTRHLAAYDRMYWRGSIDCTAWYAKAYKAIKERDGSVTLGSLRDAVLGEYRIIQADTGDCETHVDLPGDSLTVNKIDGSVTVASLLSQIAEIAGMFYALDGWGNIRYITLNDSESETLDYYVNAEAENYTRTGYDGIFLEGKGYFNLLGGDNENLYEMENDLLTTGRSGPEIASELAAVKSEIAPNYSVSYKPCDLTVPYRLWLEPGDRFEFDINRYKIVNIGDPRYERGQKITETVRSYILSRRITGIQAITDEITARGSSMRLTEDGQEPLQEETQEVTVQ